MGYIKTLEFTKDSIHFNKIIFISSGVIILRDRGGQLINKNLKDWSQMSIEKRKRALYLKMYAQEFVN